MWCSQKKVHFASLGMWGAYTLLLLLIVIVVVFEYLYHFCSRFPLKDLAALRHFPVSAKSRKIAAAYMSTPLAYGPESCLRWFFLNKRKDSERCRVRPRLVACVPSANLENLR